MNDKIPQSTPSTPQSPDSGAPASGQNPSSNPNAGSTGHGMRKIADEIGDELADAARKKLGDEIEKIAKVEPPATS